MQKQIIWIVVFLAVITSNTSSYAVEIQVRNALTNELISGFQANLVWNYCKEPEEQKQANENTFVFFNNSKCNHILSLNISKTGYENAVYYYPSEKTSNDTHLIEAILTPTGDIQIEDNATVFFSARKNIFFEPEDSPLINVVLQLKTSSDNSCENLILEAGWKNTTSKTRITRYSSTSNKFYLRPEQRNNTMRITLVPEKKCKNTGIEIRIVRSKTTITSIEKLINDSSHVKLDYKNPEEIQRIEVTDAITNKYDSINIKAESCGECLICDCRALGVFKKTKIGERIVNISEENSNWINYFGTINTETDGGAYAIEFPRPISKNAFVTITGMKTKTRKPKLVRIEETNKPGCVETSFLSGNTRVKANFLLSSTDQFEKNNHVLNELSEEQRKKLSDKWSALTIGNKECVTPCEICWLKEGEYNTTFSYAKYYNRSLIINLTNESGIKVIVDVKQDKNVSTSFCFTDNDCATNQFCSEENKCEEKKTKFKILLVPFNWVGNQNDFNYEAWKVEQALQDRFPMRDCGNKIEYTRAYYEKNCFSDLPQHGCIESQLLNATEAINACLSANDIEDFDAIIALTNTQVCGGIDGWSVKKSKVVIAESKNPLISVHEIGHLFGLKEQYCDCSGTLESRHCSSNPLDVPNPISAKRGCDPKTCCSQYDETKLPFLGMVLGNKSRPNVYGTCNNWCSGNFDERSENNFFGTALSSRTVMSNAIISRDILEQIKSKDAFYSLDEMNIISKRMGCTK